jgi:hypothetical protein
MGLAFPQTIQISKRALCVEVEWRHADILKAYFEQQGVVAVLYLDAVEKKARLEILSDVPAERIKGLLDAAPIPCFAEEMVAG